MYKLIIGIVILLLNLGETLGSKPLQFLPFIWFTGIIFSEKIFENNGLKMFRRMFILPIFLMGLFIVGLITTQRPGLSIEYNLLRIVTLLTFSFAFLLVSHRQLQSKSFLEVFVRCVYAPVGLYLLLNLFLFFINIKGETTFSGSAIMLSSCGFESDRIRFYFASGINSYGVVAGAFVTASFIGASISKKYQRFFLAGLMISLATVLLTDSRGPLIWTFIAVAVVKGFHKMKKKSWVIWIFPLVGFFGPVLLLTVLAIISNFEFSDYLTRSSGDIMTGNSRLLIWETVLSDFTEFKGMAHLFGYGEFGHYAAGLSQQYGNVFGRGNIDFEFMHPHNTFLSVVLDLGLLGLLIFLLFQFSLVRIIKSRRTDKSLSMILMGFLLYFNLVGIGETLFGFYYQNIMFILIMISCLSILAVNKSSKPIK